jgi:hypothetical protein
MTVPRLAWAMNKLLGATAAETIAQTRDDVYLSPARISDISVSGGTGAWGTPTEVTLDTNGVLTITEPGWYTVDTFEDAASDTLVKISGLDRGDEVILSPESDARSIIISDGTYMILSRDMTFTMDSTNDCIVLQCVDADNDVCRELGSRISGGE